MDINIAQQKIPLSQHSALLSFAKIVDLISGYEDPKKGDKKEVKAR